MVSTVRIKGETHQKLQNLAKAYGVSMQVMLDEAVEELERKKFFKEMNAAYEKLQQDPVAWEEELQERAEWDATLMDDLEDDSVDDLLPDEK